MESRKLVETLKKQHSTLREDLNLAMIFSQNNSEREVLEELVKFKKDLTEHLSLEDNEFYPKFLQKKTERGEDAGDTRKFIEEMKAIGTKVISFLEKYEKRGFLKEKREEFSAELKEITSILKIRMETEEDGLYDVFLLM